MKQAIQTLYAGLKMIEDNCRILTIILMTAIIFIQVVARIVFKWSSPAMEEAARFIMIWSIFIGAVVSTREDSHIRMGGFAKSVRSRALFNVASKLTTFLFLCVFVKWSYDYAIHSHSRRMNSIVLNVPLIVVHSCFLITGTLMALHTFIHFIKKATAAWKLFFKEADI
ncbi:MAG: TRAP transporter small permease subunit [Desulfobacteraceae bacterium]|nr:TRAP transporter small permease subunit [Desulfobacteraceae bacterium]